MMIKKLHHVAYRCKDAQETVDFYTKLLGLRYSMALSEERVPSTGERSPYMHVFFEMEDGSSVAFFEVPESPEMQFDPNTPSWVQHLALEVGSMDDLLAAKKRLEDAGIEVVGVTDHSFVQSIYFRDPSGHRLELTVRSEKPGQLQELESLARPMLDEWNKSKKTVKMAEWVHKH